MEIRFYKKELRWYADLPEYIAAGGDEADCEMVAGADTMLDWLTKNEYIDQAEITLELSDTFQKDWDCILTKQEELEDGLCGCNYRGVITKNLSEYNGISVWLCPVTIFVFEKYPDVIFVSKIV